ncbi:hypothetical protein C8J57DRAFT_1527888 [Mycena rebaudengoi]|nr:hypothetical protein C8J57DRAFT_1527888 [Mycena rebaudengoi]
MTFLHDWGLPGIDINPPPLRDGYRLRATPQPWNQLKFTPLGLYDLRRCQGIPTQIGVFQQYSARFLASDLGWLAAGSHTDGMHTRPGNTFFPELFALRESLPIGAPGNDARKRLNEQIQNLTFDLATSWDRLFGGTTMILHVEGTTVPNTPPLPQFLRSSVYLPPSFIAENPASHGPIARIAQIFIESVGVPTVQRWRSCATEHGWSLSQTGPGARPNPTSATLIPQPQAQGAAHYKFFGRPNGVLDTLLAPSAPVPVVLIPDDDFDNASRIEELEMHVEASRRRIQDVEEQETILVSRVAALVEASESLQKRLESTLDKNRALRQALNPATHPTPSTPTRSQASSIASAHSTVTTPSRTQAVLPSRSQAATPSRSQAATPSRSQAMTGSSRTPASGSRPPAYSPAASHSRHQDNYLALDAFISAHGLDNHVSAIKLVMRTFHPVKWHEELVGLDIEIDIISPLLAAMAEATN